MKYFTISIAIHAFLFWTISGSDAKSGTPSPLYKQHVDLEIVKPPPLKKKPQTQTTIKKDLGLGKSKIEKIDDCLTSFGGLGVEMERTFNSDNTAIIIKISRVFSGYPAAAAGLKPGHIIVAPDWRTIRGPVGTPITLIIKTNPWSKLQKITLIRARVCTEKLIYSP